MSEIFKGSFTQQGADPGGGDRGGTGRHALRTFASLQYSPRRGR